MAEPAADPRFVLGTVQLGMPYGRRRGETTMDAGSAEAILERAWALGITAFDTAEGYGVAPERLVAWLERTGHAAGAEVVTKVPTGTGIGARAGAALDRFGSAGRRTVLSHGAIAGDSWSSLRSAAEARGATAGQSVYECREVVAALEAPGLGRVQAPGSVFDNAALVARGAARVPLDLRSVLLQGVLLERPEVAERRAPGAGALAHAVRVAAAEAGADAGALLIAAMLDAVREGDRLVLGVDEPEHLEVVARAVAVSPGVARRFRERALGAAGPVAAMVTDPRSWP